MRSKASIQGHPLHPILIAFPVAFLSGALLFDLLARWFASALFMHTSYYMLVAGIIGGAAAAVPGLVDYLYTVPPNSSAKRTATIHLVVNSLGLAAFVLAAIAREPASSGAGALLLELAGLLLISFGGYLGGRLVYRNQIGVDHRYAGAGKWSEVTLPADARGEVEVARAHELKVDQMRLIRVGSHRIVLARTEDSFVAFDDSCTHRGGSLAGGQLCEGIVACPWHGSQFDVRSGMVCAGPAERPIATYKVSRRGEAVYLVLPGAATAERHDFGAQPRH